MAEQEISEGTRKNAELLVELLKAGGCNFEALDLMIKARAFVGGTKFEHLFMEVLKKMQTDEPHQSLRAAKAAGIARAMSEIDPAEAAQENLEMESPLSMPHYNPLARKTD